MASQVAPGNENALRIRLFGTRAGLEWRQEHPNQLIHSPLGEHPPHGARVGALDSAAARVTRNPLRPSEGYLEAFATLYSEVALAIDSTAAAQTT